MSKRHRRFVIISGMFFAILLCLSGGTAAVFLAQRLLQEEPDHPQTGELADSGSESTPLSQQGLLITGIDPASPAGQANLQRGQIILRFNGTAIDSPQTLQRSLQTHSAGDTFTLDIFDGRQTRTITLIMGDRESYLGAGLLAASTSLFSPNEVDGPVATFPNQSQPVFPDPGLSQELFLRTTVIGLVADSPAANAGLQTGDIITNVDETAVLTNAELIAAIGGKAPGENVLLTFRRGANTLSETITLTSHPNDAGRGFLGVQLQPTAPASTPDQ